MEKFFYLHIPKTAGNFFNTFLSFQFDSFIDHIEVKNKTIDELKEYECFSGHIPFPKALNEYSIIERKKITILRNPIEQVISHISFVRELAEPDEKDRFLSHAPSIQKIALKLKETDLSNPKEIEKVIKWLETNGFWLFHDCQTRYLGGGIKAIKPANLNLALTNLEKIDYIGITERLQEFMILLSLSENFQLIDVTKENITRNRYGLDINKAELRKALQPLIQYDHIIYREAREKYIDSLYTMIKKIEKQQGPRFSALRVELLYQRIQKGEL